MTPAVQSEKACFRIQLALPFVLFLCLAGDSLAVFFTGDDVMNLFKYLEHPQTWGWSSLAMFWSSAGYRPLGGVVYVALYKLFGFHPAPFRIFLMIALLLNLALCYRMALKVSQSRQIALWTILFCSYHAALNGLWLNFGTIYDVLGYSCFFGALLTYIAWIGNKRRSGTGIAIVALLYLAGLEFKEIVVTLPAVLLLWNLLFTPDLRAERWRWPVRSGLPIMVCGVLGLIYIAGKMSGPESLARDPAYAPHWTMQQYSALTAHYIRQIFYLPPSQLTPAWAVAVPGLMIAAGALIRSRIMVFSALSVVITQLPVSFIAPRRGFVLYIAFAFWGLYAAAAIERFTLLLHSPLHAFDIWVIAVVALAFVHVRMKSNSDSGFTVQTTAYESLSKNLDAWRVRLEPGTRVLIVNDPFPDNWVTWDPMFLINLRSHLITAVVNRLKLTHFCPPPSEINGYDYVIDYDSAWLLLKRPGQPLLLSPHMRNFTADADILLGNGFRPPIQGLWRETGPEFTIQTRAADAKSHQISVSLAAYSPVALSVQVDGSVPQKFSVPPIQNFELMLPIAPLARPQMHTLTFRDTVTDSNKGFRLFFVGAQLR